MAGSLRLAYGHGRACLLYALATVLREKGNEIVHHLDPRRIDHGMSITADADQSGIAEPVEVSFNRARVSRARTAGRISQRANPRVTEAQQCFGNMPGDRPTDRDAPGA
jgi:hypothetical protein